MRDTSKVNNSSADTFVFINILEVIVQMLGHQSVRSEQTLRKRVQHLDSSAKAKFDKLFNIHQSCIYGISRTIGKKHRACACKRKAVALQDAFVNSAGADVAFWFCHNCHGILEVRWELFPIHGSLSTILASRTILSHALPHANTKLR